jgi:hypothetical protein
VIETDFLDVKPEKKVEKLGRAKLSQITQQLLTTSKKTQASHYLARMNNHLYAQRSNPMNNELTVSVLERSKSRSVSPLH